MTRSKRLKTAFASSIVVNNHYQQPLPDNGKLSPTDQVPGGAAIVASPTLAKLGAKVTVMGRFTKELDRLLQLTIFDQGVYSALEYDAGPPAVNVILPPNLILRATRGPKFEFKSSEARFLLEADLDAIAVGGSLPNDYVRDLLAAAAGLNKMTFWNPGAGPDLSLAAGCRLGLQVSYQEFNDGSTPTELCRKLLITSGAVFCIVTDAENGAYGVERCSPRTVVHFPAIPINEPLRTIGAGDAHFAGVIAAYLLAPANRLERAMAIGRLVAVRHVLGLAPGDWAELTLFERSCDRIPTMRSVA